MSSLLNIITCYNCQVNKYPWMVALVSTFEAFGMPDAGKINDNIDNLKVFNF